MKFATRLLAATALYRGSDNKLRTEEVDAERADYLRYLSVIRDNVRAHADEQRAGLEWSHPDPAALAGVIVAGTVVVVAVVVVLVVVLAWFPKAFTGG